MTFQKQPSKGQNMQEADQLITSFLKISNALEQYMHQGKSLTPLQHQTLATTVMGLQTIMQAWERKAHSPELQ